jgi:cob(I)alamin adenosyltransferase
MKIYTKTGDKGTTALYTGERLIKDHKIFNCLGDLDELNASLGLVIYNFIRNIYVGKRICYKRFY